MFFALQESFTFVVSILPVKNWPSPDRVTSHPDVFSCFSRFSKQKMGHLKLNWWRSSFDITHTHTLIDISISSLSPGFDQKQVNSLWMLLKGIVGNVGIHQLKWIHPEKSIFTTHDNKIFAVIHWTSQTADGISEDGDLFMFREKKRGMNLR